MKINRLPRLGLWGLALFVALLLSFPALAASPSPEYMSAFYQLAPSFIPPTPPALDIPQTLTITQPTEDMETAQDSYFIAGYSDPTLPLYMGGDELDRLGTKGVFGVAAPLSGGENLFTFAQGGESWTISIYRHTESTPPPVVADGVLSYSMVPSAKSIYRVGDILILSCTAPKDAKVQVLVGQDTVTLSEGATLEDGVHAPYSASYTLPATFPTLKTTPLGALTYQLIQDDDTRDYESLGDLYVAGRDAKIRGAISSYTGFVYPDLDDVSLFKELLKKGSVDYITDQYGDYYQLASGGSVPRYMLDIQENGEEIRNPIEKVEHFSKAGGEVVKLFGQETPAYDVVVDEEGLTLLVYHSTIEELALDPTPLFKEITTKQTEEGALVTLPFKDPTDRSVTYWGYNVVFDGEGDLYLEVEYKPTLKSGPHPLEGIKIVLDPGHGGDDPGSLGITGEVRPYEEDINLAHAYELERRLSALGATVVMTRYDNSTVELDDRFRMLADTKADLFVSLHHNSVDMRAGYEESYGTETYYHTHPSGPLSQSILNHLSAESQRVPRGSFQSYYRVTLLPYAPSVLVELGFISHPLEFEKACTPEEIKITATGIVNGLLESLV